MALGYYFTYFWGPGRSQDCKLRIQDSHSPLHTTPEGLNNTLKGFMLHMHYWARIRGQHMAPVSWFISSCRRVKLLSKARPSAAVAVVDEYIHPEVDREYGVCREHFMVHTKIIFFLF